MTVKVKFNQPHTVISPGTGSKTYNGTMELDMELAKRWQERGYLEILKEKNVDITTENVEVKPKRTYKKVKQDGNTQ